MNIHTKEPWEAVTPCPGECCWNIQPVDIDRDEIFPQINHPEMSEADAKRIVACVNACIGIPTDILLKVTIEALVVGETYTQLALDRNELVNRLIEAKTLLSNCILPSFGFKTVEEINLTIDKIIHRQLKNG